MSASGISINPAVYARLPYDAVKDFVAVSELASFPLILIVSAASPIKSVAELVAYAKANPDKTNYASSSASFQLEIAFLRIVSADFEAKMPVSVCGYMKAASAEPSASVA